MQQSNDNPFGRTPVDQVIEQTVNRDTQTARGTRNFSLNASAVSRYYLTAEFRAMALSEIKKITTFQGNDRSVLTHADLKAARTKKDLENVLSLVSLVKNDWTNPFELGVSNIVHISSGDSLSDEVSKELIGSKLNGEKSCQEFLSRLECGEDFYKPIKKVMNKQTKQRKNPSSVHTYHSEKQLFSTIILLAETRNVDLEELFSYPLSSLPFSISNPDGSLKKTGKCSLGSINIIKRQHSWNAGLD